METMLTEIKIQLFKDGTVQVYAPFDNQILSLGLMEIAKDLVKEQGKKPKSNIITSELKLVNSNG